MFRLIILFFLLISTPLFSQNKEKNISINVFPNPANEYINLKINNDTSVPITIMSSFIGDSRG